MPILTFGMKDLTKIVVVYELLKDNLLLARHETSLCKV